MSEPWVDFSVVCACALVAILFPGALYALRPRTRIGWLVGTLTCAAVSLVSVSQVDWSAVSFHLRWLSPAHVLVASSVSWVRRGPPSESRSSWPRRVGALASCVLCVFFTFVLVDIYQRDRLPSVALRWPLSHPRSLVMQGGASPFLNHHIDIRAQRRALDIVALNRWGRRVNGLLPQELADYEVYGEPVRAPCTGRVVATRASEPDRAPHAPPLRERIAGNYVLLHCDVEAATVILAHLQTVLKVMPGEHVHAGEPLGRIGNSGNSTEPHLHLHAVRGHAQSADEMVGDERDGLGMWFAPNGVLERGNQQRAAVQQ